MTGTERKDENHRGIVSFSGRTCSQVSNEIVMQPLTEIDFLAISMTLMNDYEVN